MSAENTKDSFYELLVSETGDEQSFKKIERLTSCGVPNDTKVLDEVTSTSDRRTIKVSVDFKEESEIEFEYVLLPDDAVHQLLQTSFDTAKELTFLIVFIEAKSESRQFVGIISDLTTDAEDTKKKLRKKGKISITGEITKKLTA